MKKIAILGSTGSIGTQTLDVIAHDRDTYSVEGLAAGANLPLLLEQIRLFQPKVVSVHSKEMAEQVKQETGGTVAVYWGEQGLTEVAAGTEAETVLTAVVGSLGLKPTLAAIEAGKDIALANKETLVCAGAVVTEAVRRKNVRLLPVDSEHSAIFQCLNGENRGDIRKLIITASGGSFRDRTRDELKGVTLAEALRHPNWSMGAKITIDSATMSNKGLEVIEAHWLFGMPYDQIEVLLHPESVIHSMVEYCDNSVIAQLGNPDMRVPIQYALTYPSRRPTPTTPLNLAQIGKLHFKPMDFERFPNLAMAFESGKAGGTSPAVFNAANEVAVSRFVRGEISFLGIEEVIARTLSVHQPVANPDLEEILAADTWARSEAAALQTAN
ncbi:1-deoxy-D-xylulose-5-phosphate reductoisomerase [Gorillibacterium massiliense]|uniref:1-deoxy-D-xylulose-5-phosphate reductoisomerase n=1 Tax=Gorillibacterium massiliense TaxID=1280390 RepID=UPI00192E5C27|nr:1-deoxy-D-xylulose-5-phosphate reductoisomerase [Gorillibacterium massiliense]